MKPNEVDPRRFDRVIARLSHIAVRALRVVAAVVPECFLYRGISWENLSRRYSSKFGHVVLLPSYNLRKRHM